jgi:hypothetical protein
LTFSATRALFVDVLGWDLGDDCHAEDPGVALRLVTAPGAGMFVPGECHPTSHTHRVTVDVGDALGLLVRLGGAEPVRSPCRGRLRGLLALPGERVRNHQPLAWITVDDDEEREEEDASSVRSTD